MVESIPSSFGMINKDENKKRKRTKRKMRMEENEGRERHVERDEPARLVNDLIVCAISFQGVVARLVRRPIRTLV